MKKEHENFIAQCKRMKTLNFPSVAIGLNLNWHKDLKPLIGKDERFTNGMREVGEEIKYELMNTLLEIATKGKLPGRSPEIGAIRTMISIIDDGFLGKVKDKEEEEEGGLTPAEEAAHLARMGISK